MGLFKKSKTILVVEDEKDIAEGLSARLGLEEYKVSMAEDGMVGVEKARTEKPDLIIMDVMMPKVNGFEACEILKRDDRTRGIPILILTALPYIRDAEKALELGASDFLTKPYTNERLIEKVRKLL